LFGGGSKQAHAVSLGSELCHLQQEAAQAVSLGSELCHLHKFWSSF
jgi:hypothetical protein